MPTMRGQPRLVFQPHMYQRLLDFAPSRSNALEFCVGTVAEMTEGDVHETVDHYSRQGKIAYIHLRNVVGKVPHYRETFIDEGDVDMVRILSILERNALRWSHHPRSYSANVLCRALACRHGAHIGFHSCGESHVEVVEFRPTHGKIRAARRITLTLPTIRSKAIPSNSNSPLCDCGQRLHSGRSAVWLRQHRDQRSHWLPGPAVSSGRGRHWMGRWVRS